MRYILLTIVKHILPFTVPLGLTIIFLCRWLSQRTVPRYLRGIGYSPFNIYKINCHLTPLRISYRTWLCSIWVWWTHFLCLQSISQHMQLVDTNTFLMNILVFFSCTKRHSTMYFLKNKNKFDWEFTLVKMMALTIIFSYINLWKLMSAQRCDIQILLHYIL